MSEKIKVEVVGSWDYPDLSELSSFVEDILAGFSNDIEMVSGKAKEVDKVAKKLGRERFDFKEFLPEFKYNLNKGYSVEDYHKRNKLIAEYYDVVFAFQYKNSSGTQSTIDKCRKSGTPVFVYEYEEANDGE